LNREDIRIEGYKEGQVKDLVEVYQREPIRYLRSLEEFRLLAERGFLAYIATKFIYDENEPSIAEYAGPRDIVLCLIKNLFKDLNIETLKLTVPHHDSSMLHLLESQKLEKPRSEATASMAIINPQSFLEKIQPYLEEKMGKKESHKFVSDLMHGQINLYLDGKEVGFQDPQALTLLFFGAPEKLKDPSQPKVKINPYRESLLNVLPLPTPMYELNYI